MGVFITLRRSLCLLTTRKWSSVCQAAEDKPKHLICFKQWTTEMVCACINSAIQLKMQCPDTHMQKWDILKNAKILILEEVNEPFLFAAVSKAASFLGADDFGINDKVLWDSDYNGRVFSGMSDAIFVSTTTHMGVQRLADQSSVPVMCVKSRTHATIQALAIVMTVVEHFGTMKDINFGYIGPPLQCLNSLLLLCPMLGANIRFKCSCPVDFAHDMEKAHQSPLLLKLSADILKEMGGPESAIIECNTKENVLNKAHVVIAGPTCSRPEKVKYFALELEDLEHSKDCIFIHCCPRGLEVTDELFDSPCAYTFAVFDNMQYIAASLMANAINNHVFE